MSNLDELTQKVDRLHDLLHNPHPGLSTWRQAYEMRVKDVLAFFDDAPAEPAPLPTVVIPSHCCPDCGSPNSEIVHMVIGTDVLCANPWHEV